MINIAIKKKANFGNRGFLAQEFLNFAAEYKLDKKVAAKQLSLDRSIKSPKKIALDK